MTSPPRGHTGLQRHVSMYLGGSPVSTLDVPFELQIWTFEVSSGLKVLLGVFQLLEEWCLLLHLWFPMVLSDGVTLVLVQWG